MLDACRVLFECPQMGEVVASSVKEMTGVDWKGGNANCGVFGPCCDKSLSGVISNIDRIRNGH